jgi:aryl-alcohol dehydrogenase-like predicted oxidoreductase
VAAGATPAATSGYPALLPDVPAAHFRALDGLTVSSIGAGTYLGEDDDETDRAYSEAIVAAAHGGVNLFDTAINYRSQRSERALGAALAGLGRDGLTRDRVVVCTKGGYLPFDGAEPPSPDAYVRDTYLRPGILGPGDLVAGCHAMTPAYLADQLGRSLGNLGLDHVDVYYVHNPETQLGAVPRAEFRARLGRAFAQLEAEVAAGRIGRYGVATWNGFRHPPEARDHLGLADLVALAAEVAGPAHHFRVVQLPVSLAMPEALVTPTQPLGAERVPLLRAAAALGIAVVASAPLLQGQLAQRLPHWVGDALPGLTTHAQRAVQFVRSAPGLTAALVGMSRRPHVAEALAVARVPPHPAGVDSLLERR